MLKLYSHQMSSASYRVRIALALKGLEYEIIPTNLNENQHLSAEYGKLNPQKRVPMLMEIIDNKPIYINQSLAIIEYLDEKYPNPPLLPYDFVQKARSRAFAYYVASDIFPLQNLSTRNRIAENFGADKEISKKWCHDVIANGFAALENELGNIDKYEYLFADYPTLADICLVPQMRNARRYGVDLAAFPKLCDYEARLMRLSSFTETA